MVSKSISSMKSSKKEAAEWWFDDTIVIPWCQSRFHRWIKTKWNLRARREIKLYYVPEVCIPNPNC